MAVLPTLTNLRGVLQKVIFVPIVYGFVSLLPVFLAGWENSDRLADRLFSTIRSKENMFDFIVVGGGTAGSLIANRLAEHYRVLLLEAGGTPSPFQTVPALALKFLNHPQTDWGHKTVPQRRACLNSVNQQSSWSSGRSLGGTSNLNFMAVGRGHPMDFENWAEITGDPTWGYNSLVPYFKRFETFSGTSNDPEARGHDGELRIRKPNYVGLSEDWIRAGQELGYPFVDLNGRHEEGFGILQYPIFKGLRQSTYSAFLLPMHKSPRLTIRRYATVRKILFRDMNNKAYGVEYVRHGHVVSAIATKEVILSAGTLGSSKLLMLSGVGPRDHLEELGIPVRSNLRVGQNLQDHLAVHLGPFFMKEPKSFLFDRDVTPENIVRFLFLGTGPITTTGYQGAASIASNIAKKEGHANWPDLHLILHGQAIHQGYIDAFAYAYSLQEDEIAKYYSNAIGRDSFTIYVVNSRPTSHGQVLLGGASITDPLVINPRYLEDNGNRDFKVLLEGVKTAMTIANTSMFHRLGTEFTNAKLPGCTDIPFLTDAYWECYIRRFTLTMHNPVGTVPLGDVVDSYLRVRGTRGLRVIDASIQPAIVTTGTMASTLMIAEKGVDMILKDHGIPDRETDLFDVVFGKNGFFKRNPILRILQREFDTINPLRAIFKPFTSLTGKGYGESDAKERFTRNGRIDNPFLQVISTFFGNANKGDNSASGSAYVDVFESNQNKSTTTEKTLHLNKRSQSSQLSEEEQTNKISKNQWILQKNSPNNTSFNNLDKFAFVPQAKTAHEGPKLVLKTLNITELSTSGKPAKGKGGRRYALLQKLLREAELNVTKIATKVSSSTSTLATTPRTTQITPTQIISATLTSTSKPIVEIVKFEKVNSLENEIPVDGKKNKLESMSSTNNSSDLGINAKPIGVNPQSIVGLSPVLPPVNNILNTNQPAPFFQTNPNNPLSALFRSLKSFEQLMYALTAKDRRPIGRTPSSAEGISVSQTTNWFHNGGIFGNLFGQNKNQDSKGVGNIGFGKTSTITNNNNMNNNNPFQFLFGNNIRNVAAVTTPSSKSVHVTESIVKITLSSSSSEENNATSKSNEQSKQIVQNNDVSKRNEPSKQNELNKSTEQSKKNDLFSSWFKPLPTNKPSSSWFKPFDKPADTPPSSNWFKPLSSNNDKQDSWIKPIDTKSWLKITPKSNNEKPSSNSWFQPFNLNNALITPAPSPKSAEQKQTKNSIDSLGEIFELFFGGLKKNERREVFKAINTMMVASKGLSDLVGSSSGVVDNPLMSTENALNFFEQISKGKNSKSRSADHAGLKISDNVMKGDEHYDTLLRDLISLNKMMDSMKPTLKPKTKIKPIQIPTRKVKPISEEIDEEFIFDSITTESSPPNDEVEVTTEIDIDTTTVTTEPLET